jgi:hypothetical protein
VSREDGLVIPLGMPNKDDLVIPLGVPQEDSSFH